ARRNPVLPLIPGVDCAGIVDALGKGVTRWKVGAKVAAAGTMPLQPVPEDCENYDGPAGMMGIKRPGGSAELVTVPACVAVRRPFRTGSTSTTRRWSGVTARPPGIS